MMYDDVHVKSNKMCCRNKMTDIQINDFDLNSINERRLSGSSPVVLIIGGRGRGKSQTAKAIMRVLRKIPSGCVFSGTETSNPFYEGIVPSLFTFTTFEKKIIQNIIAWQRKGGKNDVFVLLDDLMYDPAFLRQPLMRGIFLNGRHYHITLVITTQYAIDVPPALRGNVDYIFLLRENNIQTIGKLHKNFGGLFPNVNVFQQALKVCTRDFGSLVLDNVNEKVHKYRVDMESESAPFRMFSSHVWTYAGEHTASHDSELDIVEGDQCRLLLAR